MGEFSKAAVEAAVAIPKWRSFLLEINEEDFLTTVQDPGTLRLLQTMDAIPSSTDQNLLLMPSAAFLDAELQAYYVGNAVSPSAAMVNSELSKTERETNMSNDAWLSYCFAFGSHGDLVKQADGLIPTHSDSSHLASMWESMKVHYEKYVKEVVAPEDSEGAQWMAQQIASAVCPYSSSSSSENAQRVDEDRRVYVLLCTFNWVLDTLFYKGDLQICDCETVTDVQHYEIPLKKGYSMPRLKASRIIPMFDQRVMETYSKKTQKVSLSKTPVFASEPSVLPVPRKTLKAFKAALQTELNYALRLDCGVIIPTDPEHCFRDKNTTVLKKSGCDDNGEDDEDEAFPVWGSSGPLIAIKAGQDLLRIPSDGTACKSHALNLLNEDADWLVPTIMLGSQLAVGHKNKTSVLRVSVKPTIVRPINLNQFMEESHREKNMQLKRCMFTSCISSMLVSPNSYTYTTISYGSGQNKKTRINSGFSAYNEQMESLIGRFTRLASGSLTRVWGMFLTFSLPAAWKRNQELRLKDLPATEAESEECETCQESECFEKTVACKPKALASLIKHQNNKKKANHLLCFMNNRSFYSGTNLIGPLGNLEDQKTSFSSKMKKLESAGGQNQQAQQQQQQQQKKTIESYEAANFEFAKKLRNHLYSLIETSRGNIAPALLKVHNDPTISDYQKTYKMTTMVADFVESFVPTLIGVIKAQCREADTWMKEQEYGPNTVNFDANPVKGLLEGSLSLSDKLLEGPLTQTMAMVSNLMLLRLSRLHASHGKLQLGATVVDTLKSLQEIMEKSTQYSFSANWGHSTTAKANVRVMDGCNPRPSRKAGTGADEEDDDVAVQKMTLYVGRWLTVGHVRAKPTIYSLPDPSEAANEKRQQGGENSQDFLWRLVNEILKLCFKPTDPHPSTFPQVVTQLLRATVEQKRGKIALDRSIGRNIPDNLPINLFPNNDSYLPVFCSMILANFVLDKLAAKPAAPRFLSAGEKPIMSYIGGYSSQRLLKRKTKRETSYCDDAESLKTAGLEAMADPQEIRYNNDVSFLNRFSSNILAPMCINTFPGKGSVFHKIDVAPIYNTTEDSHIFGSEKIDAGQYNSDFKPNRRVLAVPSFVTDIHSLNYEGCFGPKEHFQAQYGWTDTNNIRLHQDIAFGGDFAKQSEYLNSSDLLMELMADCYFTQACRVTGNQNYKEHLFVQRKAVKQYIALLHQQQQQEQDEEEEGGCDEEVESREKLKEWVKSIRMQEEALQFMQWNEAKFFRLMKEGAETAAVDEDDSMLEAVLELAKAMLTGAEAYNEAKRTVQSGEWYSYLSGILQPNLMNAAMDALNKIEHDQAQAQKEDEEEIDLEKIFEPVPKKKKRKMEATTAAAAVAKSRKKAKKQKMCVVEQSSEEEEEEEEEI